VKGRPTIRWPGPGQITKWFGTCTDIEDQKRIEEALRQSQKRIRALIDSNIIGITSNEGGKKCWWKRMRRIFT